MCRLWAKTSQTSRYYVGWLREGAFSLRRTSTFVTRLTVVSLCRIAQSLLQSVCAAGPRPISASIFLAGLLFLWLRYTLKDDRQALLWTSVAAASWPPIQVLSLFLLTGTGSIDAAWYVGLAVPYVAPAAGVLFRWP